MIESKYTTLPSPTKTIHHTGCISRIYQINSNLELHTVSSNPQPWNPHLPPNLRIDSMLIGFLQGANEVALMEKLEVTGVLSTELVE